MRSPALRYVRANSGLTFRPDSSCVLWLPGQDDAQSATIRDRSGNGNDGTITGATWTRNSQGLWYLDFDGSDDIVDCGNASILTLSLPFTLEAWYEEITGQSDAGGQVIAKSRNYFTSYQLASNKQNAGFYDGANWRSTSTTGVKPSGSVHLVVTYVASNSDTVLTIYFNALIAKTDTLTGQPTSATTNLKIGASTTTAERFKGKIALARIYNRALSASEIGNHYNQERHLFGV